MKLLNLLNIIMLTIFIGASLNAQVKIGDNPTTINSSSLLELESTDKGILIHRLTMAQRDAIASPIEGLMIFQTDDTPAFYYYNGASREILGAKTIIFAQLSDDADQQPSDTNPTPITFSTNNEIQGIIHTSGSDTIEIVTTEIYNMVAQPQVARNGSGGAPEGVVAISGIVSLAPGDYVEVWVENTTDASYVTIESINLSIL